MISVLPLTVLPAATARAVVTPHREILALAVARGWYEWRKLGQHAPAQRQHLGRISRAASVNDFVCAHAERLLGGEPGVSLAYEHGRLMVFLGHGTVKLRFKKLDRQLRSRNICTERQLRLQLQLDAPMMPGMPNPTVLTVGYVLDTTETLIRRIAAVCQRAGGVEYVIELHLPTAAQVSDAVEAVPAVVSRQVLAPVIRSTRRLQPEHAADGADTELRDA